LVFTAKHLLNLEKLGHLIGMQKGVYPQYETNKNFWEDIMKKSVSRTILIVSALFLFSFVILLFFSVDDLQAIPAFARKYETSCSTCHYAFPKLNAFGKVFKNNGYRYPVDEEGMRKEEPISLGAEAYKKVFPKAIWPADMARKVPVALQMIQRINVTPDKVPNWEFEFPHEIEVFAAGTIGETFSYFGEIEIEHEDEVEYSFWLQYDPGAAFHIKMGSLPLDLEHLRLTAAHYNIGNNRIVNGFEPSGWRFRDDLAGMQFWGAINGPNNSGGFTYSVGVANGQGIEDNNDDKDFFARASYKFGGMGEAGGAEEEGEGAGDYWKDNHFRIGAFSHSGQHSYEDDGSVFSNDVDVIGAEFEWWFENLILTGAFLNQTDDNPAADNIEVETDAWFAEANYVFFPWLIGLVRYESTDIETNLEEIEQVIPAVVFLPRANIRFVLEGQIRLDDAGKKDDKYVLGMSWSF
jgi:hypothetical protein